MIDYFALLDQPRAPWLDVERLKETYHQKTLQTHPDVHTRSPDATAADTAFASLNEAYQVLQDPKRRLHHLLSLEGSAPSSGDRAIPMQLQDLFPKIGELTQRANLLTEKLRSTSNALSRSLLKPQTLEVQKQAKEVRETIQSLTDASLHQLRQINVAWDRNPAEQIDGLSNLYFAFAYLTRWSKQLDEMTFQLSLH
jgi:curved DNA-binding protein CbpA